MYTISKEFHFSGSHQLHGLREGHPCGRLHGHNWIVELELQAKDLDVTGFVKDYGDLDNVKSWIDAKLEHRHMNDVLQQPSAENLAMMLFTEFAPAFPELSAVRVRETPKTCAEYRP